MPNEIKQDETPAMEMPSNNRPQPTQRGMTQKKEYATDKIGMMNDAKTYAKKDYTQSMELVRKLGIDADDISDELIGKALIAIKYKHIEESRLNRTSIFDPQ